jgi:hypothetical protein
MVPTSQKKKILAPINFPGRRRPCEWVQSAVTRAAGKAKSTARLRRSTLASLTVSVPLIMTHTGLGSNPANVQSPMCDQPLPMPERAQQLNGLSPRQSPRPRFRRCSRPHRSPRPRSRPHRFPPLCRSPCPHRSTRLIPHTRTIPTISIPHCLSLCIPILRGRLLHIIPGMRSPFRLTPTTCSLGNVF